MKTQRSIPSRSKKAASPGKAAVKNFHDLAPLENSKTADLASLRTAVGPGTVICMANDVLPIDRGNWAVPVWVV